MDNIFEKLFQYGYHDTDIYEIYGENLSIKLKFNNGVYMLDDEGKETCLTKPIAINLKINSHYDSFKDALEIREYGKKIKYIDYDILNKYLLKERFGIWMLYYSKLGKCILIDGGIMSRQISLFIEGIEDIDFQAL